MELLLAKTMTGLVPADQGTADYLQKFKLGAVLRLKGKPVSRRSLDQNFRLWGMLADISRQVDWYGQKLLADEWKDVFTAALKRLKVVPGIDGGFVVVGGHTSKMTIAAMGEMIDFMFAFGDERGVAWKDPTLPKEW